MTLPLADILCIPSDDETTREQLFPHLDSLQQPQEIRNYLDVRPFALPCPARRQLQLSLLLFA